MNSKNRSKKNSICEICGKSFFAMYSATGKYCSRKCGSIGTRKRELRNCLECGAGFTALPSDTKKYCNAKCFGQAVIKKFKKEATIKTCLVCGAEFERRYLNGIDSTCSKKCAMKRANQIESERRRLPDNKCGECGKMFHPLNRQQKSCSLKCGNRIKARVSGEKHHLWKPKIKMNCEICGQEKEVKPSLVSRFRACSRRCVGVISQIQMPNISSIEVKMQKLFEGAGLAFTPQFVIGQYVTDFAFPKEKLVVECDGDYWHNLPNQKVKDRRKDGFLKHNGWKIVRLWEYEINNQPQECLSKVLISLT